MTNLEITKQILTQNGHYRITSEFIPPFRINPHID